LTCVPQVCYAAILENEGIQKHMLVDERRHRIASLVLSQGAVTVAELSERLDVSAVTIRSDLEALERHGMLKRNHGGAVAKQILRFAPDFLEKSSVHPEEKEALAQAALELVQDGDRLLLDAGGSTLALAHKLHSRELSVVTNSVYLLNELFNAPRVELIVVGGNLNQRNLCFVGPLAEDFLGRVHVDKAFVGINGISAQGISVTHVAEAGVKRKMIESANEVIVLADNSKIGIDSFVSVAPLDRIDKVVTGPGISAHHLTTLGKAGVEVIVA